MKSRHMMQSRTTNRNTSKKQPEPTGCTSSNSSAKENGTMLDTASVACRCGGMAERVQLRGLPNDLADQSSLVSIRLDLRLRTVGRVGVAGLRMARNIERIFLDEIRNSNTPHENETNTKIIATSVSEPKSNSYTGGVGCFFFLDTVS